MSVRIADIRAALRQIDDARCRFDQALAAVAVSPLAPYFEQRLDPRIVGNITAAAQIMEDLAGQFFEAMAPPPAARRAPTTQRKG